MAPSPTELVARLRSIWQQYWDEALTSDEVEAVLEQAASMIEGLAGEKAKLMGRLERDHAFRLVDGKMVRVEMELDDDTDGIACRDATIIELENQLKSTFTRGFKSGLEAAAAKAVEMEIAWHTEWRLGHKSDTHLEGKSDGATELAAAIRSIAVPEER